MLRQGIERKRNETKTAKQAVPIGGGVAWFGALIAIGGIHDATVGAEIERLQIAFVVGCVVAAARREQRRHRKARLKGACALNSLPLLLSSSAKCKGKKKEERRKKKEKTKSNRKSEKKGRERRRARRERE